jgi:hypothetical protein
LWASLTRFSTSESGETPLLFYLNALNATDIWISIDSSGLEFPIDETQIRIGQPCGVALASGVVKKRQF